MGRANFKNGIWGGVLTMAVIANLGHAAKATVLVNDTWQDGERNTPAAPIYSEYGVNSDPGQDTDLESAWYRGGGGSLDPVGPGGPLRGALADSGTSSSTWTTYFTPEATPVVLTNTGDQLLIRWDFQLSTVNASNNSQDFRITIVDSPADSRLTGNGSPGSAAYTGYAVFANMGQNFGHGRPFELKGRVAVGELLSASAAWTSDALVVGGTNGNEGYADSTPYTYLFTATRNADDGIDIVTSVTGGNINGTGHLSISYTDESPASYAFDTFSVRPSRADRTAFVFNTSLFRVEFNTDSAPPVLFGDFNDDGIVDAADYTVWRNNLGNESEDVINNAGDGMGGVDSGDYEVWKQHYGQMTGLGSGGIAASVIPEPASIWLMAAAVALAITRRRT